MGSPWIGTAAFRRDRREAHQKQGLEGDHQKQELTDDHQKESAGGDHQKQGLADDHLLESLGEDGLTQDPTLTVIDRSPTRSPPTTKTTRKKKHRQKQLVRLRELSLRYARLQLPTPPEVVELGSPSRTNLLTAAQERRIRQEYEDEFAAWIRTFRWDVWMCGTFWIPLGEAASLSIVHEFMELFGPEAYAAVAFDRGPATDRLHVHLLIGGLSNQIVRTHGHTLWRWGLIRWDKYDPSRGAANYLAAKVAEDANVFELVGRPRKYRIKKRGRKQRRSPSTVVPKTPDRATRETEEPMPHLVTTLVHETRIVVR